MFVFPSSVNITGRRFFIASTVSGRDVKASRRRFLVLGTGEGHLPLPSIPRVSASFLHWAAMILAVVGELHHGTFN
jgi:hypothetical protein